MLCDSSSAMTKDNSINYQKVLSPLHLFFVFVFCLFWEICVHVIG